MCKETLEMMLCLNRKELETQVVMQCAPLLTGIKISNLLTTDQNNRIHTARLFSRTPVSCFLLCQSQGKAVFLLYMKEQLKAYLDLPSVKGLMKRFGYTGMKLDEILSAEDKNYASGNDIKWNFTKFLVDQHGKVVKRYEPTADMNSIEKDIGILLM